MAYSNTSEFYSGLSAIDDAEHSTHQNVYFNQIPPNYQIPPYIYTHEDYIKQENYSDQEHCIHKENYENQENYNYEDYKEQENSSNQENYINQENYVNQEIFNPEDYIKQGNYSNEDNCINQEQYINQEIYPTLTPGLGSYVPAQIEQNIAYGCTHFYENSSVPQYNPMQYTPLTPEPVSYPVFHLQPTQPYDNCYFMEKRHRAQITILPTSKGNFKAVVKRKRKRTVFTTEQVEALEDIFKTKQYINREERQQIVKKLQLNDKSVKIWFQNRRLKNKRVPEECDEESENCPNIRHSVEEMSSPDIARLDLVESQITKKTDEFGYVTLDDGVMGELVNVIDDFVRKNVDVPSTESTESDSSPIYEPISPASITDSNEEDNSSCWKPSEPNESLQRLFDLQNMLSL